MPNAWTLVGPHGSLNIIWPTGSPIRMQTSVVGMSQRVIGRPYPVFRHFAANTRFTLHHLLTGSDWDTAFGQARTIMQNLSGAPDTVDFLAMLEGPDGYNQSVRIVDVTVEAYPQAARAFRMAIGVEEATL